MAQPFFKKKFEKEFERKIRKQKIGHENAERPDFLKEVPQQFF
jgi:hypothetical protein